MALDRDDYLDPQQPQFGKPAVSVDTPNVNEVTVVVDVPVSPENYEPLPYGSPHPDNLTTGLNLRLVWQGPVRAANNQARVKRIYSTSSSNQDWHNFVLKYSGDSITHPIYIRTYRTLREGYTPATPGLPLRGVVGLKLTSSGSGYTSKPTVAISGGGGSGATAEAIWDETAQTVTGLTLTAEGDSYTSAPTVAISGGGGSGAGGTASVQSAAAVLVREETAKYDQEKPEWSSLFIKVTRVYETLPGPWLTTTSFNDDGTERITTHRRNLTANISTAEALSGGTWTRTVAKETDNEIVADETVESIPVPGNAVAYTSVDPDGVKVSIVQTLKALSAITSQETLSGGIWTETHAEKISQLIGYEVTTSRAVPGNPIVSTEVAKEDGATVTTSKTLKASASITTAESIASGVYTSIHKEDAPYFRGFALKHGDIVAWEVKEQRPIPGNDVVKTVIDEDGDKITETRTLVQASTLVTTTVVSGEIWTRTTQEDAQGSLLAWKVVRVKDAPNTMPSYTVEIPDLVPEEFRALIPTSTTRTKIAGTASLPTLGTGDIRRTERQLDQQTYELEITTRSTLSIPQTITGIKQTNDKKQVVSVALTLEADTATPTAPTATTEVDFRKLGNGLAVQIVKSVPSVFPAMSRETGVPNVVPQRFSASTGFETKEETLSGTVPEDVTLASGEIHRRETQIDTFIKRVLRTLFNLSSTPTLRGQEYNARLNAVVPYLEVVEASGASLGNGLAEIEPLSDTVDLTRTASPSLPDPIVSYGYRREQLPLTLVDLTIVGTETTEAVPTFLQPPELFRARYTRTYYNAPPTLVEPTRFWPQPFHGAVEYTEITHVSNSGSTDETQSSSRCSSHDGSHSSTHTESNSGTETTSGTQSGAESHSSTRSGGEHSSHSSTRSASESGSTTHSGSSSESGTHSSFAYSHQFGETRDTTTTSMSGLPLVSDPTQYRDSGQSSTHSGGQCGTNSSSLTSTASASQSGTHSSGESATTSGSTCGSESGASNHSGSSNGTNSQSSSRSGSQSGSEHTTGTSSESAATHNGHSSTNTSSRKSLVRLSLPPCLREAVSVGGFAIPATEPTELPWDSWLTVAINSEVGRYGIWIVDTVEIWLPSVGG